VCVPLQVEYGADTKKKNKYKHDPASYAVSRGYSILTAEFNQILFDRRVSAISRNMQVYMCICVYVFMYIRAYVYMCMYK
jgi:hypothetical protein